MRANKVQSYSASKGDTSILNQIDKRVGSRIRLRRRFLGYSQEKLALALGLTFQQIQKYEKGTNRVGASRLFDISQILQVPINFFFDELLNSVEMESGFSEFSSMNILGSHHGTVEEQGNVDMSNLVDVINSQETVGLLKAYYSIKDKTIRQQLLHLIKAMGESP